VLCLKYAQGEFACKSDRNQVCPIEKNIDIAHGLGQSRFNLFSYCISIESPLV
jgi:hypothetical protein